MNIDIEHVRSFFKLAYGTSKTILANHIGVINRPRMAYLLLTWKCNLRCVMCGVWKEERYKHLNTEQFLKLIDNLPPLDVVKIGGGEPFMRNDCAEIVGFLQKKINPYYIMLITNGTMTERTAEFAERCGRPGLHLRLSIEGRGAVHDKLRGREGCFDKTIKTLEALIPIMKRRKFTIGINYNVTPETIKDLPWILDICRREKLNFIPGFWVYPFLEDGNPEDSKALIEDFEDYRRRLEALYKQDFGLSPLEAYFLKKTVFKLYDQALESRSGSKKFACRADRNIAYVLPNGNLVTCGIQHEPLGNLAEQNFDDVWYSAKLRAARSRVDSCPGCCQYAIKIMSEVYTGQTFGLPAPYDWKRKNMFVQKLNN